MSESMQAMVLRGIERALTSIRPRRLPSVSPPLTITDGTGRKIHIRPARDDEFDALVAMYEAFDSSHRAQGIPPLDSRAIEQWLDGLLTGPDVIALHDGRVVGHVSFVPEDSDSHELAIFVHQEYQGAGIGTHLLSAGLDHAATNGVGHVWLTVERRNRRAKRLYRRGGFSTVDPRGAVQRMSRYL